MTDNKKEQLKAAKKLKKEALKVLEELTNKIALTDSKNPETVNWAVCGDLGFVCKQLNEVNRFFQN